jgi:hypothetical protein
LDVSGRVSGEVEGDRRGRRAGVYVRADDITIAITHKRSHCPA